jgi:hypothetical protein
MGNRTDVGDRAVRQRISETLGLISTPDGFLSLFMQVAKAPLTPRRHTRPYSHRLRPSWPALPTFSQGVRPVRRRADARLHLAHDALPRRHPLRRQPALHHPRLSRHLLCHQRVAPRCLPWAARSWHRPLHGSVCTGAAATLQSTAVCAFMGKGGEEHRRRATPIGFRMHHARNSACARACANCTNA